MVKRLALTRKEAAEAVRLSVRTLDKLLGIEIATVRVGRRRLVPQKALEDFLRKASK